MSADYLTTDQVADAVGVGRTTIVRWEAQGVLPTPVIHYGGRRGRVKRWPLHTAAQALWVQAQLEALMSWDEIRAALAAGKFRPEVDAK